ncbi:cold-shock protein [Salinactinospora qingdaonensis]|uniref:Cold shock domain-containing protein n=1 Tax=Salinactinospora qingdaonensis TaxID=702744 RepID=A0ABP7FPP5_9ACTN
MATGKIVRFDDVRGYGFIAPDNGDEDVFMHANDLQDEKYLFRPGLRVEFDIEDGDRGLKASDVRIIERGSFTPGTKASSAPMGTRDDLEDGMCDVLSAAEFRHELTEALLETVPSLTGSQVVQARKCVLKLAQSHSWVES